MLATILICGALNASALFCRQASSGTQNMPHEESKRQNSMERRYRLTVESWKQYIRKPGPSLSSDTSDYTGNEPYHRIVALGTGALPFLIADLERGEFLLNDAVRRITGLDVQSMYPKEKRESEQDVSKLWVRWWREKGRARYQLTK